MPPHRLLAGFALLALLAVAPAFAETPAGDASSADVRALHVLNRLGYGPRPGDVERVEALGIERYIDQQLAPNSIAEPDQLRRELAALDTLRLDPLQLFRQYGPLRGDRFEKPSPEEKKARREAARIIVEQAIEARLHRATESPRQLQEVMVDFWFNHFNVFAGKELDHLWVGAFEAEAIRPHVFGRFRDLLLATAGHPAMLFYLDNWQNTAPGSPGARGKQEGLNENYARELMELHTLGVNGGYTQADVIALARILTGWGIGRPGPRGGGEMGGFVFDQSRHDFGDKQFLGHVIKGRGMAEAMEAFDILARSPATAKHIAYQLAQYFVADDPPPALVERLARRYQESDGNIGVVLKTLFTSPDFWSPENIGNKFKTPYQFVVSALRATALPVNNIRPVYGMLAQLGEPLYGCQTPDGYKDTEAAWLNPDAMTRRLSFATALASGRLPLDRKPPEEPMRLNANRPAMAARMVNDAPPPAVEADPVDASPLFAIYRPILSARTTSAFYDSPLQLRAALLLGSPEFMRH
jgi:uncharacterized protein (DUF1800 family)